jgi:hypothetical protein
VAFSCKRRGFVRRASAVGCATSQRTFATTSCPTSRFDNGC